MDSIQSLRGTKDIYGEEALLWEEVEAAARSILSRFGFEPVRTPLIEEAQLFARSVGEATDIVQKEMYRFTDRSDTAIALRPEGTASVVRFLVQSGLAKARPANKFYYYGPMFRAERPQKGRLRQFHQIGAEFFGSRSELADAEVIEALVRFLESLGVSGSVIQVNNLGDPGDRETYTRELKKYLSAHLPKLCDDCRARADKNAMRVLDCKKPSCASVIEKAPRISDHASAESRKRFEGLVRVLGSVGIACRVNPRIVRGLDYYTGAVFEVTHSALGSQDALAAGGRYDGLVESLGGASTPAVGFALGVERLLIVLKETQKDFRPSSAAEGLVAVMWMGDKARAIAYQKLSELRRAGVRSFMDFEERPLDRQFTRAEKLGARYAVVVGPSEAEENAFNFKDMISRVETRCADASFGSKIAQIQSAFAAKV